MARHVLSDAARRQARALGLTERDVTGMAHTAAPFTHPSGNRRHNAYVLRVVGRVVENVERLTKPLRPVPSREVRIDALFEQAELTCDDVDVCRDLMAQDGPAAGCEACAARWVVEEVLKDVEA